MPQVRLTPLDAAFLELETSSAHMHIGWVALLDPPVDGAPPSFEQLRDHIGRRLARAPRFRQRLAGAPGGLVRPTWVDDDRFELDHHVRASDDTSLAELTDRVLSCPLDRDRPLWEMWIADRLEDGRIALVGKTHHCVADGIAAVTLGALLVDGVAHPPPEPVDTWEPSPASGPARRLLDGLGDELRGQLRMLRSASVIATSPTRSLALAADALRVTRALGDAVRPAPPVTAIEPRLSAARHLTTYARPLDDLLLARAAFGATVNDVLLAAVAGALRNFLGRRGDPCPPLKVMVAVNVRDRGSDRDGQLGNRIAFVFVDLPCHLVDPVERLHEIHEAMRSRKEGGIPDASDAALRLLGHAPQPAQRLVARLGAGPRAFNLAISNIPGPSEQLYVLGCPVWEVFPVVPLADRHAISIGLFTIRGRACFGIHTDPRSLPDADRLADDIGHEIDALLGRAGTQPNAVTDEPAPLPG